MKRLFLNTLKTLGVLFVFTLAFKAQGAWASEETTQAVAHGQQAAQVFFWIAIILIAGKVSSLVERIGQPAVLGELLIGVLIGNLALFGFGFFEPLKHEPTIAFLAELGVVILLLQIGLESSIKEMMKVGVNALLVAAVGVVLPFVIGTFLIGPWLLPGESFNTYLFIGAAMTATSVGITARVFKDLGALQTVEARIVLGAAVIDDVLGLVILAVCSVIVTTGTVGLGMISWITAKALLFLVGSIIVGQLLAPWISRFFSRIQSGHGMKFTLVISICLLFAYGAQLIGLAPIVGAFAAGLILRPVHFKHFDEPQIVAEIKQTLQNESQPVRDKVNGVLDKHSDHHLNHLIEPVGHLLVPIFFVMTGIHVRLETLFDVNILWVAVGMTVAAIIGKLVAGLAAGKVSKSIVGWGMVPRGEVGLIFAMIGRSLGVVTDQVFSIIVIMVIVTTLITPPMLTFLLKAKHRST